MRAQIHSRDDANEGSKGKVTRVHSPDVEMKLIGSSRSDWTLRLVAREAESFGTGERGVTRIRDIVRTATIDLKREDLARIVQLANEKGLLTVATTIGVVPTK